VMAATRTIFHIVAIVLIVGLEENPRGGGDG
jgi:hypothetical protein